MRRTEYGNKRGERRSFYCPYYIWDAIKKSSKDCYSVSTFINMAIKEKLKRDFPETYNQVYNDNQMS